jgi:hypothetical protein
MLPISKPDDRRVMQLLTMFLLAVALGTAMVLWSLIRGRLECLMRNPMWSGAPAEYRATALWGSSAVAFATIAAWVIFVAVERIVEHDSSLAKWIGPGSALLFAIGWRLGSMSLPTLLALVITVGLVVGIVLVIIRDRRWRRSIVLASLLGAVVVVFLVGPGPQPYSLLTRLEMAGFPVFSVTRVGNTVALVAVTFIIAAVLTVISEIAKAGTLVRLRAAFDSVRLLLYSSAAFLAVGVVEIYLLWGWTSQLAGVDKAISDSLLAMAQAVAIICGTIYSLMLLVLFVPAGLLHERRLRELVKTTLPDADAPSERSVWAAFADVVALAGPILTALGIPKLL